MDMKKKIFGILATLLFATQAHAIQISSTGDTFNVDWSTTASNGSTLSATSIWTVTSFSSTQIGLTIDLTNTTTLSAMLTNADITSFGFGVDPNATATFASGGQGTTFTSIGAGSGPQQTFPGGYQGIDVCVFTQNCSGGSVTNALHAGASDSVDLILAGDFSQGFADLLFFPLKFQTNVGSYEPAGNVCVGNCTSVPEPSILALMGIGLVLIGVSRKRKPAAFALPG